MQSGRLSNTTTLAPAEAASAAALPPAAPAPRTTTLPRGVEAMPPSSLPLPPFGWCRSVVPIWVAMRPAMTDIGRSSGRRPVSSPRLKGDAGQADIQQALRERRLGSQVQVAEQQVVLLKELEIALDRFLDLDD